MGLEDNFQKAIRRADTQDIETHRKDRLIDLSKANGITVDEMYTIKNEKAEGARFGIMTGTIRGAKIEAGGRQPTINGKILSADQSLVLFGLLQDIMSQRDEIDGTAINLTHQEIAKTAELYNNPEVHAEWTGTQYEGHTLGSLIQEFQEN